jgi:hypothetical protein
MWEQAVSQSSGFQPKGPALVGRNIDILLTLEVWCAACIGACRQTLYLWL